MIQCTPSQVDTIPSSTTLRSCVSFLAILSNLPGSTVSWYMASYRMLMLACCSSSCSLSISASLSNCPGTNSSALAERVGANLADS